MINYIHHGRSISHIDVKLWYAQQNWLPRRVMSAWRIAGILHGLEGWNDNEYGNEIFNVDKVWEASLHHGFTPLMKSFT